MSLTACGDPDMLITGSYPQGIAGQARLWRPFVGKLVGVNIGQHIKSMFAVLVWLLFGLVTTAQAAGQFYLEPGDTVFGTMAEYTVQDEAETLVDLAIDNDLGYNEIVDANPDLDPWYPRQGKRVVVPTAWLLPSLSQCNFAAGGKTCIVVNLAEYRLYRIQRRPPGFAVQSYPVGIGRDGYATHEAKYRIVQKIKNPAWIVPPSVLAEYPDYPRVVPPGPDNPLGDFALRLSQPDYLIHGTNKPLGVGRRVSRGCIRMYPEDIEQLFREAKVGESVVILYQPLKIGRRAGGIYVEAHENYLNLGDNLQEALALLRQQGVAVDEALARTLARVIEEKRGVPVPLPQNGAAK